MFKPGLVAIFVSAVVSPAILGFHLAEYPKDVIRASMGSPVVLTCVVHCSQSQSCRIEWLRAQTHSHVSQSRPNYIEVPSTYYGNKGLIYPTYTHNYTLTTTSMKIESKLVIQRLTPKYTGVYKCRAVRHHRAISSPNVSVELHAASGANQETTWRDMVRGCSIPRISDFMVEQYQNNTQNETICIKVKWTYSPRKEKWCKTTNWSLMHASWDSSEANNLVDFSDLPSSSRQLLKIDNSRELQYTCGLNASRYHKFQLSFQFRKHHLKYNSHVYFFQRQVPAQVVKAPFAVNVKHGDLFTIGCQVDGFPTPNLEWITVLTGTHTLGRADPIGHGNILETYAPKWYNRSVDSNLLPSKFSTIVACVTSNTLYNPPEGSRTMTAKWNMQINID